MSDKDFRPLNVPPLGAWPQGVNQVADIKELQRKGAVRAAQNIDFKESGKPRRRRGQTRIVAGYCHSLFAPPSWPFALFVKDGALTRLAVIDGAEALTPIATINSINRVSYAVQNGDIYLSNGLATGKVNVAGVAGYWGLPSPGGQPALSLASTGGLDAGRYQIAVTFLTAAGEESGAERAVVIEVAAGQGITLTHIPQPPAGSNAAQIRVYASPANGDSLYAVANIPVGVTSYTLTRGEIGAPGRMLETMLHERVPPSSIVRSHKGRIYFAIGDTLFYTPALRYGLYKRHTSYNRVSHEIRAVAPVNDGFFVGTDYATYWISGDDPKDQRLKVIDGYGIVPFTDTPVRNSAFGSGAAEGFCQVWWNTNGNLVRGDAGGSLTHLTRGKLALPRFEAGAVLHREQDQISQLVSALKGPTASSSFAATDRVTMQVFRNGVEID